MANRNNRQPMGNRRVDFGRLDRSKGYGRPMPVSPWQQGGPGAPLGNILPLATSSEATLALANNLINNLLQSRQNTVPSLLDMPIRRDFGGEINHGFDRGYNRMGNQPNFRRGSGNYVRPSDRPNYRKAFRPNDGQRNKQANYQKKDAGDSKPKSAKTESVQPESKDADKQEVTKEAVKDEGNEEPSGDAAAESEDKKEPEKKETDKKDAVKTVYDGINPALLHCHICNKVMWDGRSFENHLNGRAHHIMMQKTAESYALTADTMRQELKIREMKHYRKLGQSGPRNFFCAMCDMYAADGAVHRTTIGHRKLKKYLHPACTSCHKEMPTRIDLDEHRLTAEHLLSVQGRRREFILKPKPEVMVISTLNTEESYVRFDRKDQGVKRPRDSLGDDEPAEEGGAGEGEAAEPEDRAQDGGVDTEKTVLDWKEGDDLNAVTPDMIPRYLPERGVGRSFLGEFTCVQCTLCRKLLDSRETAEVHLRTWRHHLLFVKHLQRKDGKQDDEAAAAPQVGAVKRKVAGEESEAKRRNTAAGADGAGGAANGDHQDDADGEVGAEEAADELGEEEVEMQEEWEKDIEQIMKDVAADDEEDEKRANEEPAEVKEEPVMVKESPAKVSPAKESPVKESEISPASTPSRGRATRGRGRGRGMRARRS